MAKTCNPADRGATYNTLFLYLHGISLEVRWTWDGTSVYPACDGPLTDVGTGQNRWAIRAINADTITYYAHTTDAGGRPRTWALAPGQTALITAGQAAANGYLLISDFGDMTLTTSP